jgi:hypothetical protein
MPGIKLNMLSEKSLRAFFIYGAPSPVQLSARLCSHMQNLAQTSPITRLISSVPTGLIGCDQQPGKGDI